MTLLTFRAPLRRGSRFLSFRIVFGGTIVAAVVFCALFAPLLAPHPPAAMDLLYPLLPPIWAQDGTIPEAGQYLLGTDSLGRDVLTRLIYGARVAIYVAVTAGLLTMLLGGTLGILAGYFGGWVDWIVVKLTDLWMCFPPVVLSMILMIGLGAGVNNIIIAIMLVDWTRFCRVIRGETLVVARTDYIAAARLLGYSPARVLARELLPAVAPMAVTLFTLEMGIAVIVEAILSFVGMGVESTIPAWGQMIADARLYMYQNVWAMLLPVLAIFLTVLGFNLLGDGLRNALDPRMQEVGDDR